MQELETKEIHKRQVTKQQVSKLGSKVQVVKCNAINATQNIINVGTLWVMDRRRLRKRHVALMQSHGGIKRAYDPMKILHHGHQNAIKVLTREPMNDRIYHTNYDTFNSEEVFMLQLVGVKCKAKRTKKLIMKNAKRENLTYMLVSRSLLVRIVRYDEKIPKKMSQQSCIFDQQHQSRS
jgi:hypothetical protein